MVNKLCKAGLAVTCRYKRNAKPHTACACSQTCISEEIVTVETHGTNLVKQLEAITWA